ncbi:MAG: hypothetical protein WKF81_08285 [Thermomicrobiales bacterium]
MTLPDLQPMTMMDDRLRQIPIDRDRFELAMETWRRELERARTSGDRRRLRTVLANLGSGYRILGDFERADTCLIEARRLASADGSTVATIAADIRLAELDRCHNRYAEAEQRLRSVIDRIEVSESDQFLDFALQHLGKVLIDSGQFDDAQQTLERSLLLRKAIQDPELIASTLQALDHLSVRQLAAQ